MVNVENAEGKANEDDDIATTVATTKLSEKRSGYLEWDEYFMAIAFLSAQRSKDPRTQVGACIINSEKKIVGIGYNGMPIGCSDDVMPWNRTEGGTKEKWLESKSPYVCHAELNAVLNKNLADIKGCIIYVALFPCNRCAQIIIQSRISEVIYYSDKYHDRSEFEASRRMFDIAGVKYWQFKPRQKKIIINFGLIEATPESSTLPANGHVDNNDGEVTSNGNNDGEVTANGNNDGEVTANGNNDGEVTSNGNNDGEVTSNSNNCGAMKSFRIENHAEQQQFQDIDHLQLQLPRQQTFWSRGPPWFNNVIELYFAITSALFIVVLAVVIWFLGNSI